MIDKQCIICYENDNNLIYPNNCNCKVLLHKKCLEECKKINILCPICRVKYNGYQNNNQNMIFDFLDLPMLYFINNPNIINFIMIIIYSWVLSIFILLPSFLILYLSNKVLKITIKNPIKIVIIFYTTILIILSFDII